ncbi:alpha-ketoglutarate-dependent dioxygenase AlkB family protein [Algoriphagus sediminis]|uniref:Alpha-ketoglutarate-dependent dioxygenase AlkB n=1 Tax=Algoriphagus sediminis TaxID=3057113 RepID=A0ABT7Y9W6_9BACT|nr:alpha-ketoglutarate-dependent dioxygenase AlkB [Algoriphagus sediminis]MDN3203304.1 alpha-ketoglutarate-dependent dioxygenase AlkB [Algoriphagus sediminis]
MQQKLFFDSVNNLIPFDGEADYFPEFFTKEESARHFLDLRQKVIWKQEPIKIFGKEVMQPRLTALYGNPDIPYGYSGIEMESHEWIPVLQGIKNRVEDLAGQEFTHVLLNYYRDGQDSMGWHRDNESVLGKNPVIASVSFGEEREFQFRHYERKQIKRKIMLQNGSLLIMKGATQHFWEHQLPKRKRVSRPRINLTFRKILT